MDVRLRQHRYSDWWAQGRFLRHVPSHKELPHPDHQFVCWAKFTIVDRFENLNPIDRIPIKVDAGTPFDLRYEERFGTPYRVDRY